jgi:hypothetical protein
MDERLQKLHDDLKLKRLRPAWAKLEIVFGLTAVGFALFGGSNIDPMHLPLFVLGAYLAMAGHRSHIYQSQNRLTGHLAEIVERSSGQAPAQRAR